MRLIRPSIGPGLDESIRMLDHPPVIDRQLVGNEIKNQTQTTLTEPLSKNLERLRTTECGVHLVTMNGVRRAHDIRSREVRQRPLVLGDKTSDGRSDLARPRAALPYAHEPDSVEAKSVDPFEFRLRNVRERDRVSAAADNSRNHGHVLIS